jgi:hypothetical protein
VQAAGGVTIGTTGTAGVLSVYNGTNTVSIQGAGSTAAYSIILPASVAGAANQCLASTGSNGTLQWLPCGAGSTAAIALSPEFVGAVMSGDGSSNTGTKTSDYCAGTNRFPGGINTSVCNNANNNDEHNYYSWTSTGANDYEIFFRWTVPNDFAGFPTTGSSFYGWKTGTAVGDDVKLNVYNNSSTACAAQSMTNTANSWLSTSINLSGCTPSTGTVLTFDIHLSVAASGNFARIGEITLNYNRK